MHFRSARQPAVGRTRQIGEYDLLEMRSILLRRLRFHPIQVCLSTVRVNDFARVLDGNWALFSCLTKDTDGVNGKAFLGQEMIHFGVTTKPRLGLLSPVRLFL